MKMKRGKILFMASAIALFGSCSNEQLDSEVLVGGNLEATNVSEVQHVCLDVFPDSVIEDDGLAGKALVKAKLWNVGQTIKVKFLGGSNDLQNRVMANARIWEDYANIKFEVVTTGDADIRVDFVQNGSSYSYIGTDASRVNQNEETMNFGWFTDNSSNSEIKRTTLHEFGHALGAIHEHQSPVNEIQWDVDAVYEQYANLGWTQDQVESNLFRAYSASAVTNSVYDPESIMHYPIGNNLTLNNFSVDYNTDLSDLDKEFINISYPFSEEEPVQPETNEPDVVVEPVVVTESGENIALGRSTFQSSVAFFGDSSRAVDGNTDGVWRNGSVTHTESSNGAWWRVDLDETTSIEQIIIFNRVDCCSSRLSNFYVEVLNESGRVTGSLAVSSSPSPSLVINANGTQAKSVRIRLAGTDVLSLAEVQVIKE